MRLRAGAALLCASLTAGCSLGDVAKEFLKPVQVEVRTAVISAKPPVTAAARTHPGTLLVLAPETDSLYDTARMAYATQPTEIAYFAHIEWAERPGPMIQPLLGDALRARHAFEAVESPPFTAHYRYTLRTEIRELRQDFGAEPAVLRFRLHAHLADEDSGRTLLERDYEEREPMRSRDPDAGVAAANAAVAKALGNLAADVGAAAGR